MLAFQMNNSFQNTPNPEADVTCITVYDIKSV